MAGGADTQFLEHAEDMLAYVQDCQSYAVPRALCIVTNVSGGSARSAMLTCRRYKPIETDQDTASDLKGI